MDSPGRKPRILRFIVDDARRKPRILRLIVDNPGVSPGGMDTNQKKSPRRGRQILRPRREPPSFVQRMQGSVLESHYQLVNLLTSGDAPLE